MLKNQTFMKLPVKTEFKCKEDYRFWVYINQPKQHIH